jgi:cytochrome oxidase Cu insertion factor (SCO1/SenC/PrrC family)
VIGERQVDGSSGRSRRARVALAAVLLALAASGAGVAAAPSDAVEELLFELQMVPLDGQAPPPFTLETLAGPSVSLADFRGKVILLYFWATW